MLINRGATALAAGDRNAGTGTAEIFYGDAIDCQAVFIDVDVIRSLPAGVGSVYLSINGGAGPGVGAMFFKAFNAGNPGDWLLVAMQPCGPT